MKNLVNQRFGKLVVIEKTSERKAGSIVWKCQCDCGNITFVSTRCLTSGNTKSCGCLNYEKRRERIINYNNSKQKDLAGLRIGKLLVLNRTNLRSGSNIVWKCQCDCGNITFVSSNNLNTNLENVTKSCGCLKKENHFYKDLKNMKFGKLTALEKTEQRKNGAVIWKCQCDCGNTTFVSSSLLLSKETQSCGCLKSKGEEKIIRILQENNISFVKEKSFENCVFETGYYPRFDFFVKNQYIIEYDGIQHFKQTNWDNLDIIQARDLFKNEWCRKNNIPLIRIPYTHLDLLSLDDLQLETSQFLI